MTRTRLTSGGKFLSRPFVSLVAVCTLPFFLFPLLQYLAVAQHGSDIFLWLQLPLVLALLAALPVLLIAPFLLFVHRLRLWAAYSIVAATVLTVATVAGLRLGGTVRMAAFHRLAERSAPIVQAIRAHESRHGASPADLAALVPEFLPNIPSTGMAAYPRYEYYAGEEAARYNGNPWALVVFTPSGGINFDQFMYFPLQNYPDSGYGGWVERIADWAYVHE